LHPLLQQVFENGVALHEHKSRNVIFIRQMPHWQLSAVC